MIAKVTDPLKQVTDKLVLKHLAEQGIDAESVEFYQDYAMPIIVNGVKEKGKSPYAKFYRDLKSGKRFMVVSDLPMVDADGNKNIVGWDDNVNVRNPRYTEKNNLFKASVDGTKVILQVKNGQPDGRKQGDKLTFQAQLYLDGMEIFPVNTDASRLPVDPTNENYANNVLEWDYGICKRRLRLIEGRLLGSWVFSNNPKGAVRIKYNQSGDFKVRLGRFAVDPDEEEVPAEVFDKPEDYGFFKGYPLEISDSVTFYPDAHAETSSVDGSAYHDTGSAGLPWASIRDGAGTVAADTTASGSAIQIASGSTSNYWLRIVRGLFLFDTSSLGAGAEVSAATLSLYGESKGDTFTTPIAPNINIYSSAPASNTAIAAGDYDSLGTTSFSTAITYAGWSTVGYNDFALNASGLAAISLVDVSKFGSRNANYDVANSAPTWVASKLAYLQTYFAEQGVGFKPKLVVTYTAGGWAGGDPLGVAIAGVAKINGVALADIDKVNGVG